MEQGACEDKQSNQNMSSDTHRISSIQQLAINSSKFNQKLEDEKEIDVLQMEIQQLCNWFEVNHITIDDLDDDKKFIPKITDDCDLDKMREEILKYVECICSTGLNSLKTAPGVTHVIELVEEKPFREKFRQVPHSKREEFTKLLLELRDSGMIVESKSNYSSPPHVLLKPDGSVRFTNG
jgi:hypothetical protein